MAYPQFQQYRDVGLKNVVAATLNVIGDDGQRILFHRANMYTCIKQDTR